MMSIESTFSFESCVLQSKTLISSISSPKKDTLYGSLKE